MFQLVDCFFFVSLGITFLLLFLMAFHFKTRISTLEKKNDALADMCTTIVAKISQVKQMVVMQNTMPATSTAPPMHPNIFFRSQPNDSSVEIIEIYDDESDDDESGNDESGNDESDNDESDNDEIDDGKEEILEVEEVLEVEESTEPNHLVETCIVPDGDLQSEVFSLAITYDDKNSYKKMSVQMLRTLVISKGLCSDPSKMKKLDLLKMLSDSESEIS